MDYRKGDVVIEAGGFDGASAVDLWTNYSVTVHSFEPSQRNFEVASNNINGMDIVLVNSALGKTTSTLFLKNDEACSTVGEAGGGDMVPGISIDDYSKKKHLRIDHIKLDVEGFEIEAVSGALTVIEKFRPTISVAIYHKKNDPVNLPIFLFNVLKQYDFYIGHHSQYFLESMIYCIPKNTTHE